MRPCFISSIIAKAELILIFSLLVLLFIWFANQARDLFGCVLRYLFCYLLDAHSAMRST